MEFMAILQKGFLWIIILGFIWIIGYELYGSFGEMQTVRKIKHEKLIKKLQEEAN